MEARLVARLVASLSSVDIRTATGSNLFGIRREFNLDTELSPLEVMRSSIQETVSKVPGRDVWRIGCLKNYLELRYKREVNHQDTEELDELIDALCST